MSCHIIKIIIIIINMDVYNSKIWTTKTKICMPSRSAVLHVCMHTKIQKSRIKFGNRHSFITCVMRFLSTVTIRQYVMYVFTHTYINQVCKWNKTYQFIMQMMSFNNRLIFYFFKYNIWFNLSSQQALVGLLIVNCFCLKRKWLN